MIGEVPQAPQPEEWERLPEGGLFNVAAMSDAQITETYAALWERVEYVGKTITGLNSEREEASYVMVERFAADLRGLAESDPQRLRNLLTGFMADHRNTPALIPAVATTAEVLIDYDYSFTKETLMWVLKGGFYGLPDDPYAPAYAWERAHDATMRLLHRRLTPAQVIDFRVDFEMRGTWTDVFEDLAYSRASETYWTHGESAG